MGTAKSLPWHKRKYPAKCQVLASIPKGPRACFVKKNGYTYFKNVGKTTHFSHSRKWLKHFFCWNWKIATSGKKPAWKFVKLQLFSLKSHKQSKDDYFGETWVKRDQPRSCTSFCTFSDHVQGRLSDPQANFSPSYVALGNNCEEEPASVSSLQEQLQKKTKQKPPAIQRTLYSYNWSVLAFLNSRDSSENASSSLSFISWL